MVTIVTSFAYIFDISCYDYMYESGLVTWYFPTISIVNWPLLWLPIFGGCYYSYLTFAYYLAILLKLLDVSGVAMVTWYLMQKS